VLIGAALVVVLPGLSQEGAEWKQALSFLRAAKAAPGIGAGRPAAPADFDLLVGLVPMLSVLSDKERNSVVKSAKVVEVPAGTAILRRGEAGDTAYFILSGRVAAGLTEEGGEYRSLETMLDGDLFGEIAALTGSARRADVVATDASKLFQIPAEVLRTLMSKPALSTMVLSKMTERLSISSPYELPRFSGMDQKSLRDLRTVTPEEQAVNWGTMVPATPKKPQSPK
jgi:CRP-like cAMP-binding protein